jgi:hypothetical protein
VSCRHHLLFEVAKSKGGKDVRPTSLRLNRQLQGPTRMGRRPGLASSAAHLVVQRWIDDAVEQLSCMAYTCSLDVAQDYPDGLTEKSVAIVLGVTEKAINAEARTALIEFRARMRELAVEARQIGER